MTYSDLSTVSSSNGFGFRALAWLGARESAIGVVRSPGTTRLFRSRSHAQMGDVADTRQRFPTETIRANRIEIFKSLQFRRRKALAQYREVFFLPRVSQSHALWVGEKRREGRTSMPCPLSVI